MSTATVKIVRFHQVGGPEVLKLEDTPLPLPGPGEVRLRIQAIGLNRAEVMFRTGQYLIEPRLPAHNGYEAAGIVEAVGTGIDEQMIGKKYSTVPAFDLNDYGVYGEAAIVPAYALAAYPEKLTPVEGTAIWMQYITAYGALIHYANIGKGDFVLITAASSSVGVAAIEIAKAEGAVSIATTRTSKKKATLLELGADYVIATEEEDLVERVKEITKGQGAKVIFDPIGGSGLIKLAEAAAKQAMIFEYGALASEPTPFPLVLALQKNLCIRGYTLFEIVANPTLRAQAEKYIYDGLQSGQFIPKIARIFTLPEIVNAHRYMESNEQIGKIVVTV